MEIESSPEAPTATIRTSNERQNLKRLAIGIIILAGLITIVEFGTVFLRGASTGPSFVVSVGPAPASVLYTVDAKNNALAPLKVNVDGKALPALDAVKAGDGSWYYILAEPSPTPVGNVYEKKATGEVVKLTNSNTAKYNLSYDAKSGMFAYQALTYKDDLDFITNQNWDLVMYSPSKKTETVVGKGTSPHIMSGGNALVYKKGDSLVSLAIDSRATSTLVTVKGPYAISADGTKFVLYNPVTHMVDTYVFTQSSSLSYLTSINIGAMPEVLAYVSGSLFGAYTVNNSSGKTAYNFLQLDAAKPKTVTVAALPNAIPQRIYAYDQ